jgi:cytochrome oxidase Cu insertion factor (SCO1/SenC/PrrC family)
LTDNIRGKHATTGNSRSGQHRPEPPGEAAVEGATATPKQRWHRGRWMLLLLFAVTAAPIVASYLTYYVFKPTGGTTSYGALVEPQRPIPPSLVVRGEDGRPLRADSLKGKWLMISVDASACGDACAKKLYFMRQVRATQAAERERVVMVWLRTDDGVVPDAVMHAYPDTRKLIVDPSARRTVSEWLPVDTGGNATDYIYLVDPNGNLMMRFPKNPDPSKIKNDLTKLLKWSGIG